MMLFSGRSLPMSDGVSICIFIFENQSECRSNVFDVFGYFCTIGSGVFETAHLWNAQQYLFINTI